MNILTILTAVKRPSAILVSLSLLTANAFAQWEYPAGDLIRTYDKVAIGYHSSVNSQLFVWGDAVLRGSNAKIGLGQRQGNGWSLPRDWSISVDSINNTNFGLRFYNAATNKWIFQLLEKYGDYPEPVALVDGNLQISNKLKTGSIVAPLTIAGTPTESWGGSILKLYGTGTAAGNSLANMQIIAPNTATATAGIRFTKTGSNSDWVLSSRFGNTSDGGGAAALNRFGYFFQTDAASHEAISIASLQQNSQPNTFLGLNCSNPQGNLHINGSNTAVDIVLSAYNNQNDRVRLVNNGSKEFGISIGMSGSTPNQLLAIHPAPSFDPDFFHMDFKGAIFCKKLEINTTAGNRPDYVFESGYELMPLGKLEEYIKRNKHLPGIASNSAVQQKGSVDLLELNYQLLEKVEELTLYIIEQDKKINKLLNDRR